ncbi:uncharacterized protein FMAN_11107 [Fusarium mangiferae]|uniref:Uncharacterized protein n=1 Tax=Fusarium mangiferae TaxID=192010 RepID=A0A1L7TDK8_FUSMA|nr:uncharacterized protein FMAN_11107 [Fusarium mangiferae]CVK96778.1 uncharacterized protein FMAN_11107 [Fusarium mangiferae]
MPLASNLSSVARPDHCRLIPLCVDGVPLSIRSASICKAEESKPEISESMKAETFYLFRRPSSVVIRHRPSTCRCVRAYRHLGCPKMMHCFHCLKNAVSWIPSDRTRNGASTTCYGCRSSACALRMHDAAENNVPCEITGNYTCKMLSDADVELLGKLQLNQSCNWRSDLAYQTDFMVARLRNEIRDAILRLEPECLAESSCATLDVETTTGQSIETKRNLDVEHLRVQIDISNSLRGLLEVQHRRQAYREAAAGNASALAQIDADNFPLIPPRVGPSTWSRSIGITHLVDSEDDEEPNNNNPETSKAAGKKRAAPDGHGKAATGGKKPKTK